MPEVSPEESPHFGIRTSIRVSPLGYIPGKSISTNIRNNSVTLHGTVPDEWSFDACLDALPESGNPQWCTNECAFNSLWAWAVQQKDRGMGDLACVLTGGPGSGKSFTLFGAGDITDMKNIDCGILTRFIHAMFSLDPGMDAELSASLLHGEDVVDLLNPPSRFKAAENLCYSDSLGPTVLSLKALNASNVWDALLIASLAWRVAATYSAECLSASSPCHTVITIRTVNKQTAKYSTIRFIELAWHPSMYGLKQSLPATTDRFTGRSMHNRSVLMLAELARQSITNAQPNPRKKKAAIPALMTENSAITYLLQDSIFQNPCCFVIGCLRPLPEHRLANSMLLDFVLKLGQLLPIKNSNPDAYEISVLTKIPSFSSNYDLVKRKHEDDGVLQHPESATNVPDMDVLQISNSTFFGLGEKISQEMKNIVSLSVHTKEIIVFDKEAEMDVYDGIIIKKDDIAVREEKKKRKKATESATVAVKKKGYKEREREMKEKMEQEALSQLLSMEDTRKKEKVSLMRDIAGLFFRKIVYSDYLLLLRKHRYLSEVLSSSNFMRERVLSDKILTNGEVSSTIVDGTSTLLSWLGRRGALTLPLFRRATEHLMNKSWLPPSSVARVAPVHIGPVDSNAESDSEEDVLVAPPLEQSSDEASDGENFPPPRFEPLAISELLEYTTSIIEPHLRYLSPNNSFCFDKLTFPIQIGHTVVTGISVEPLDWRCEDSEQRHNSEVTMRRLADAAEVSAREALVPVALPLEGSSNIDDETSNAIIRTASKFSMTSDGEDDNLDLIQRIVSKEERKNADFKKATYADSVEVFLAGMKTLGLLDINSLRSNSKEGVEGSKDIHIMSLPSPGIEPIHCVISRFGQKVKLQVFAGTSMDQAVVVSAASRPGTTSAHELHPAEPAGEQATAAQTAQLPLVWVNGVAVTTLTVTESASSIVGLNVKGKKRSVPIVVLLNDGDIIRIGTSSLFQVVIPEEVLPEVIIAGVDQSFRLEDLQAESRGTTPKKKATPRTITPGSPPAVIALNSFSPMLSALTEWENALISTYNQGLLVSLVMEAEAQRNHFLHLTVSRELAHITKTVDRTALMSMLTFWPSHEECEEIVRSMSPSLKAQLCELLIAIDNANYMSELMNKGVYMSLHIAYAPTFGDADFPDQSVADSAADSSRKKLNSVEVVPSIAPGVPVGRSNNNQGSEGCLNICLRGRWYECRVLAEIIGSEGADGFRLGPTGNRASRCHWWWSVSLFLERYSLMQELYGLLLSECGGDVAVLDEALFSNGPASDPFVDPPQDELVGVAFLHLDSIQYLLDVVDVLPIFNFNGHRAGSIKIHMRCWIDEIETIPEYISVDKETNMTDFIERKLIVRLYFENLLDIPEFISSGLYVAFKFFFHGGTYSTSRHCGISTNPFLNDPIVIEQTITNDFIEYIKTGSLELEVYGKRLVPNSAMLSREEISRPPNCNAGTGGPSFRLRSFGISTATSPYVTATTMTQVWGEPFDWKRGGASNLEGSAGLSALKNVHALEEELKHMEDALEESDRKLRLANKLVATLRNDKESIRGELSKLQSDFGPDYSSTMERLEATESELRRSKKEIERLSKKSKVCTIS